MVTFGKGKKRRKEKKKIYPYPNQPDLPPPFHPLQKERLGMNA